MKKNIFINAESARKFVFAKYKYKIIFHKKYILAVLCLSGFFLYGAFSQTSSAGFSASSGMRTAAEGLAAQEFRRGVQAYYRGSFNDAVLQFEKALSYMPEDNLILDWLGKAYYHSGLEGTALQQWQKASESGYGGLLLQNKIEIIRERRVPEEIPEIEARFTEAGSFPGVFNGTLLFSGPCSVLPNNDGTAWITAYGTNELFLMNINGAIIQRVTGPLNGFDRPLDIIRLYNGKILISESAGDRLSLFSKKGKFIRYYGSKGRSLGQMIGPQYITEDSRNNIYVSDYGNRRVDVFDKDGNPLFFFGGKKNGFTGLKGPTGIASIDDSIFVADDIKGCIYEFDQAGNYRRMLVEEKTFRRPESMKVKNGYLVVCDSNKIFSVDAVSGAFFENAGTGNAPSRLTSAVQDINGNMIVTDVKSNEIYVMSKIQELAGGLSVQIENVNSEKFPEVVVSVRVESRRREPVVGLKENNFYITENKIPAAELKYLGSVSASKTADIAIVIDRSYYSQRYSEYIDTAVREIAASISKNSEGGNLKIICAGKLPASEYSGNAEGALLFSSKILKTPYSDDVSLDLALRLASNTLLNGQNKRSIIIVSPGKITQAAFTKYSLAETVSYMNNNSISCISVLVTKNTADEEFSYIIKNTQGKEYFMFRPEGLSGIGEDIINIPSGIYMFSYISSLSTNFGEKYLPVEVETYLLNRSGKDECGYFAPLH